MLKTAYELGAIITVLTYRLGRNTARVFAKIARAIPGLRGRAKRTSPQRTGKAMLPSPVNSVSVGGVNSAVPVAASCRTEGSSLVEQAQRANKIVARFRPGYRVYFYFYQPEATVRRVVMLDFPQLKQLFGAKHVRLLKEKLGYPVATRGGKGGEQVAEQYWARLELPDVSLSFESPQDLEALALIERTLAETEELVTEGKIPKPSRKGTATAPLTGRSETVPSGAQPEAQQNLPGASQSEADPSRYRGTLVSMGWIQMAEGTSGRTYNTYHVDLEENGTVARQTGVDLARALRAAGAKEGDTVELTYRGMIPVKDGKHAKKMWHAEVIQE